MRQYLLTIIQGRRRTQQPVIASSTMQALLIGIGLFEDATTPVSIFCKPTKRIPA